jgi:azurin
VKALAGIKSAAISIYGFHLGMTRPEAESLLEKSSILIPVPDGANPNRIYVYDRRPDGSKGKCVLYFIWNAGSSTMDGITVFPDFRPHLKTDLKRLLSFEAVDDRSDFMKYMFGYPNRSKVTLDVSSIGIKHTTYYYDTLGISVTLRHSNDGDDVVLTLSAHDNLAAAKSLTNADVVKMVEAGLPESTIILVIQHTPAEFDFSANALIQLKNAGLSKTLIEAMLASRQHSQDQPTSATTSKPIAARRTQTGISRVIQVTGNDAMRYNLSTIEVTVGEAVEIIFTNIGTMPKQAMSHNFVVLKAGSDAGAFSLAAALAGSTDHIPAALKDQVIAHTKMLGPKESDSIILKFDQAGDYPFLCSFPAHFQVGMRGVIVVRTGSQNDSGKTADPMTSETASAEFRAFVGSARITGVFLGTPVRVIVNGRIVREGEAVDTAHGITFDCVDSEHKIITFRDRRGAVVSRRY